MIRKDFVKRKISLIQDELVKLTKLAQFSFDEIASDFLKQNTVERILEKIITRALDINNHLIAELGGEQTSPPKDYRESFLRLAELKVYPLEFAERIAKSVGTRNILVHEYDEVDLQKIYSSISNCLKDYHRYCQYILDFLDRQD